MTDLEVSKLILQELKAKTHGTTAQYLKIHKPVYENGQLNIERIDREKGDDLIIAYLPVEGEYFFFAIYINPIAREVLSFDTEPWNRVSAIFASGTMTSNELASMTKLNYNECWNQGDKIPYYKTATYDFSGIEFYPNPEPDELEDKLEKMLTFLETDKEGILLLSKKSEGYLKVFIDYHRGNQLLGSFNLEPAIIKRMSDLNLSMDFKIAAWGKGFK
jgi:hypothetical protein